MLLSVARNEAKEVIFIDFFEKIQSYGPEKLKFREGKSAIVENCMMEAMRAAKKVRPCEWKAKWRWMVSYTSASFECPLFWLHSSVHTAYLWDPILLSMTLNC